MFNNSLLLSVVLIISREARLMSGRVYFGLEIKMAWQWTRIQREVLVLSTRSWVGMAVVWLAVSLWLGFTGDLEVALSFGNVVAACIALLYAHKLSYTAKTPFSGSTASRKLHAE
jgi:hypothetical protein